MTIRPSGTESIGIVAMVPGILDAEVVEVYGLVWFLFSEGHYHVDKKSYAVLMTSYDQRGDVLVRRG